MADRAVKVTLTLSASQYKAELERATKATEALGKSGEDAGKKSQGAMARLVASARENREAWTTTGQALLAVGGSITAIGIAAMKTGIEYNTLQQTSRAALTTLLGSAEAANAQMDRLDAFARNSPFAKQTFITAQQQMLAFGIETSKVLPYLDAVQQSVAAMGGSNQQISEISFIMSQISAASKITATDLMQFGQRGINAAELIGSQMGKTGAQIREDITAGALDAGEALDALAAGMQERYGGAADNVKNTITGAFDRVKAAWRDMSSELAEPFVGKEGGGMFVGLLNSTADVMRNFQAMPGPAKVASAAIAGVVGAGATAAGGFLTLAPRIVETVDAARKVATQFPRTARAVGALGTAASRAAGVGGILALSSAIIGLADGPGKAIPGIEGMTEALRGMKSVGDLDEIFNFNKGGIEDFASSLDILLGSSFDAKMERFGSGLASMLPGDINDQVRDAKEAYAGLDAALAQMVGSGRAEMAAEQFAKIAAAAEAQGYSLEQLERLFPGYVDALAGARNEAELMAEGTGQVGEAAQEAAKEAVLAAAEIAAAWSSTAASAGSSFGGLATAYQSVIDKNIELATATAESTSSAKDSWEDFYDGTTVSVDDWIVKMQEQQAAVEAWSANYRLAVQLIRDEVPAEMQAMYMDLLQNEIMEKGAEGAPMLQSWVDASPEQRAQLVAAFAGTKEAIEEVAGQPTIEVEANVGTAEKTFGDMVFEMDGTTATPTVEADVAGAQKTFGDMVLEMDSTTATPTVEADDSPARVTVETLATWTDGTKGTVQTDANDAPARASVQSTVGWINMVTGALQVDANTSQAERDINYAARDRTVRFNVSVNQGSLGRVGASVAADGGLWAGGVRKYADGGIDAAGRYVPREPMIAKGGQYVLWGEKETGWEAYISGKPGQRARNLDIWAEAGRRLGAKHYADGHIQAPRYMSAMQHQAFAARMSPVSLDGVRVVLEVGGERIEGVLAGIARGEAGAATRALTAGIGSEMRVLDRGGRY